MTTKPWIAHWPADVPLNLEYPKIPLYQLVKESAEAFPSTTAYVFEDERTSYEQYYTQIERFATVNRFFSYCRLVPGANNSNRTIKHKSSKQECC